MRAGIMPVAGSNEKLAEGNEGRMQRGVTMKNLWNRHKRTAYGILSGVSFLMMIGTLGGLECDTLAFEPAAALIILWLAAWIVFARLAGAFDEYFT